MVCGMVWCVAWCVWCVVCGAWVRGMVCECVVWCGVMCVWQKKLRIRETCVPEDGVGGENLVTHHERVHVATVVEVGRQ
jgi:hypothetical protein